jgi:pyruvate-formate lyase-activating enzyme
LIRHLDLKLSYACNNNCVHCVIADQRDRAVALGRKDFRTSAQVGRELADAAARGFRVVTFTGGEPTLRKDLPALVRAARSLGLAVGIQTNGRVLSGPDARRSLAGLDARFVVALHGPDAAVHDAITRVPGSFDQTVAAMRGLVAEGEKVTAKIVLSRTNAPCLPALAALLADIGAPRANFTFPHALGNARRMFDAVVPRYSDVMPGLLAALDALDACGIEAVTEAVPLCLLGGRRDRATESMYRSAVASEVRQLDQDARDWSRDRAVEGKAKPPSCASCALDASCEGVWTDYLDANGGGELLPVVVDGPGII